MFTHFIVVRYQVLGIREVIKNTPHRSVNYSLLSIDYQGRCTLLFFVDVFLFWLCTPLPDNHTAFINHNSWSIFKWPIKSSNLEMKRDIVIGYTFDNIRNILILSINRRLYTVFYLRKKQLYCDWCETNWHNPNISTMQPQPQLKLSLTWKQLCIPPH